jgi:hypothetical protein
MRRSIVVLGCVMSALLAVGCDNGPDLDPGPIPTPTVETFTGSVNLNGGVTHSFDAGGAGTVTATITALQPSTSILGFQIGTWNAAANVCTIVLSNDVATLQSAHTAFTQSTASLCARLHDPNGLLTSGAVSYTLTVSHP